MRSLLVLLVLLFAPTVEAAEQIEMPKEAVILTVGGDIAVTNRGPVDVKTDSLLAWHKLNFERAFAFDRPMLARLTQASLTLQPPELSAPATFKGPPLKLDVRTNPANLFRGHAAPLVGNLQLESSIDHLR